MWPLCMKTLRASAKRDDSALGRQSEKGQTSFPTSYKLPVRNCSFSKCRTSSCESKSTCCSSSCPSRCLITSSLYKNSVSTPSHRTRRSFAFVVPSSMTFRTSKKSSLQKRPTMEFLVWVYPAREGYEAHCGRAPGRRHDDSQTESAIPDCRRHARRALSHKMQYLKSCPVAKSV
jgi:hypothetical protein